MTKPYEGGCFCGAVRYRCTAPAAFSIQCYCRDCQRLSGGSHLPQFVVEEANIELSGPSRNYESVGDSGKRVVNIFCETCGTLLARKPDMAEGMVAVPAGTLDDPSNFTPGRALFEESRPGWDGG